MTADFVLIEKIVVGVSLFVGFIWLRRRKRLIDVEANTTPMLLGIFGVLPVLLLAEANLVPLIPASPEVRLLIKLILFVFNFWLIGHYFVNPKRAAISPASDEVN